MFFVREKDERRGCAYLRTGRCKKKKRECDSETKTRDKSKTQKPPETFKIRDTERWQDCRENRKGGLQRHTSSQPATCHGDFGRGFCVRPRLENRPRDGACILFENTETFMLLGSGFGGARICRLCFFFLRFHRSSADQARAMTGWDGGGRPHA